MTSAEVRVLSALCVIRGQALYACSAAVPIGNSMHATVGRVGIHGEQGPAFACCTKNQYPAWCPPTLSHPNRTAPLPQAAPLLPSPSALAASLPAYQKYAWRDNGRSMHTKPGMCLNVAGGVPLFSQSELCVPLVPLRERQRQRDHRRLEERKVMW